MHRVVVRAASVAFVLALASRVLAEPPVIVPCADLPAAVAALGLSSEFDAFGIASGASVAVAAMATPGEQERSVFRFAWGGEEPRVVRLAGRILGLAVATDGKLAYALVRETDRKGAVRSVELVRVDLMTARATSGATLPATARGLAIGSGGATLLVASRDEIRTFQLPSLASGPLYRALGENVGVAPIAGSSYVLVAQPLRIVLADLAAPQGRDGLVLSQQAVAPARLRGMMASVGDLGQIALSDGGLTWCVRIDALAPPPPFELALEEPAPEMPAPEMPAPGTPAPETPAPPDIPAAREVPAEPGMVFGVVAGPSLAEVAVLVLLGPDNVLHEAARAVPDEEGRFSVSALPTGAYRIVAAGKGGRVLICDPPFITVRVDSNRAVEAPLLKVLRAQ